MTKPAKSQSCYCGSGNAFNVCCEPIIRGAREAETAEQLMRSRYSAYATRNANHLLRSWHSHTRPTSLDLSQSDEQWIRLRIIMTSAGTAIDDNGDVEFVATYKQNGQAHKLHETSQFAREDGEWRYISGVVH